MNIHSYPEETWYEFSDGDTAPAEAGVVLQFRGSEFWLAASRFQVQHHDLETLVVQDLDNEGRILRFDLHWCRVVATITEDEENRCLKLTYPQP